MFSEKEITMNSALSSSAKLHFFTVFSASSIILIAGVDAYLEHNAIPGADIFVATAGFVTFLAIITVGFSLTNKIMKPLFKAIDGLNQESAEAAAASMQVEAASRELAEASIEESASIQETAATLEETSSMIQQNTTNTQEAAVLSKQEMQLAERCYAEMQRMLECMEKLKDSSGEISKIIKVIDTIAFQTNILSINASIEAAKIGKEGNSFAVVADEVRNLAQKSDEAAKHTESIIQNNLLLVSEGLTLAQDVEDSLSEMDQESKKISFLMDEISVASEEQARGVSEIHKAVAQMEIAVHSNAHSADECACAAGDLSTQADAVKGIVDGLSILVNGFAYEHEDNKRETSAQSENDYVLRPVKLAIR